MWTPKEVRKLIAQISGILFGIGGMIFMLTDIKATGKVNITSNLVSGQIESGSAGLLLIFFAFFLILIPTIFTGRTQVIEKSQQITNLNKPIKNFTLLQKAIISAIISSLLTAFFFLITKASFIRDHNSFVNLLIIGGYFFGVITGLLLIGCLIEFFEPSEEKKVNNPIEENK